MISKSIHYHLFVLLKQVTAHICCHNSARQQQKAHLTWMSTTAPCYWPFETFIAFTRSSFAGKSNIVKWLLPSSSNKRAKFINFPPWKISFSWNKCGQAILFALWVCAKQVNSFFKICTCWSGFSPVICDLIKLFHRCTQTATWLINLKKCFCEVFCLCTLF